VAAGYASFLKLFYTCIAVVAATLCACGYVAITHARTGTFPHNTR
jgi:hypothetical protein